jgi:asparagine synthase (glutamine-hydrolysing)
LVPASILERRSKGRLESMFIKGYMSGRPALRDFLLGGALREAGLIDPVAIDAYVNRSGEPRDAGYIRLLELAAVESWLRSFHGVFR